MATYIGKKEFFGRMTPSQIRRGAKHIIDVHKKESGNQTDTETERYVTIQDPDKPDNIAVLARMILEAPDEGTAIRINNLLEGDPILLRESYQDSFGGPHVVEAAADRANWYFQRHGPEATMTQFGSKAELKNAVNKFARGKLSSMPTDLGIGLPKGFFFLIAQCADAYQRAFSDGKFGLSGYTFKPLTVPHMEKRKVALNKIIDAAWLSSYSDQRGAPGITFGSELDATRAVLRDGAQIVVTAAPSMSVGTRPYDFDYESIPLGRNGERHIIAYAVETNMHHGEKRQLKRAFRKMGGKRVGQTSPPINFIVEQEISAYWQFASQFYQEGIDNVQKLRRINRVPRNERVSRYMHRAMALVPMEMCQFRALNQSTVDYALKLLNRVIVLYKGGKGEVKERGLLVGEQEMLLSAYVSLHKNGIWDTFFLKPGTKLQDLQWVDRTTREYRR